MIRRSLLVLSLFVSFPVVSHAQSNSYTAFDLAAGKLTLTAIPSGSHAGAALASLNCQVSSPNAELIIESVNGKACANYFDVRQPQDLKIDLAITPPPPGNGGSAPPATEFSVNVRFDHGTPGLNGAKYTQSDKRLQLPTGSATGSLAYYSVSTRRWATLLVEKGVATFPPADELAAEDGLYFRAAGRTEVLQVPWELTVPIVSVPAPSFGDTCKEVHAPPHDWEIWLDAANSASALKIQKFEHQFVEPNSFGVVLVRHSDQVDVQFDSLPAPAITRPSIDTGIGQSGTGNVSPNNEIANKVAPATAYQCTMHPIAPRPSGPLQIKVKLVSVANRATTLGERTLDVIVIQRYAGAFRVGIAGVFRAPDQKFEARTFPGSSQSEIVRTARTPIELVLGYSLYLEGFDKGRRYIFKEATPWYKANLGLYFGFGAASIASGSFDFLKSLHVGVEYELSPNLSLALTGVLRRVDQLADGAHVGGPAPATIPVTSGYVPGVAIVLNISPSFFRFPLQLVK